MKRFHHEQTARLCQAMASPTRITALSLLAQGPWSVSQLAEELGESIATTSAHLKVLRTAHLIEVEKKSREVWCRVTSAAVIRTLATLQETAQALLPEFREFSRQADADPLAVTDLDLPQIAAEATAGRLTLIDLRPESEFRSGHLPRAISQPFDSLSDTELSHLRTPHRLISYCRGPWCKKASEGVRILNQRGIPTSRLRAGVIEWQAAGLSLEN